MVCVEEREKIVGKSRFWAKSSGEERRRKEPRIVRVTSTNDEKRVAAPGVPRSVQTRLGWSRTGLCFLAPTSSPSFEEGRM